MKPSKTLYFVYTLVREQACMHCTASTAGSSVCQYPSMSEPTLQLALTLLHPAWLSSARGASWPTDHHPLTSSCPSAGSASQPQSAGMLGAPRSAHPLPRLLHHPSAQAVHVCDQSPHSYQAGGQATENDGQRGEAGSLCQD